MRIWTFAILLFSSAVFAEERPVLKWGADSEGGAPFIYTDLKDPTKLVGFEVDIVDTLADALHMKPQFIQNQWDGLIPGLKRKNYDLVVNGLEITPDRKQEINFSDPYYITFEQLTVRKETTSLESLADCKGKIVGTLKFSLAQKILEAEKNVEIRSYEGQINAYEDLANGRLDAVLMDSPIALYYGSPNPKLKLVGKPIGRMEYGIGIRRGDEVLLQKINTALKSLSQSGKLREIYERWGMWNTEMSTYLNDFTPPRTQPTAYETYLSQMGQKRSWTYRAKQYLTYLPLLGKGALITLELTILAMILAVFFGLLITLVRLYAPQPFSWMAMSYVEVIRGTPLLIQLYFIFYALPGIGINFSPFVAALVGLALNYAAYEAENYRAGIISIPKHQMEAALALGMTRMQSLRYVIVPQAMRLVIPPVTNDFISLLKDSSLVSVITLVELTRMYGQLASTYYDYLGTGILVAAMYFLIGLPFVRLSRIAERYFAFDHKPKVA